LAVNRCHPDPHRSWWIAMAVVVGAAGPAAARPAPPALVPAAVAVADVLPEPRDRRAAAQPSLQASSGDSAEQGPGHLLLAYPLLRPALQQDPWGWRYAASRGSWRMHTGLDLAADSGTPVLAARGGRVVLAEAVGAYGLTVVVDHGEGLQTLYAHLREFTVRPGDWLEQGQALGSVGMSGRASGPHLHFEVRRRGDRVVAINPTPHLPPPLLPALPALLAVESVEAP
jgi:murein DD-endopeptidase MepM/ murein hydrolase activator NlpD